MSNETKEQPPPSEISTSDLLEFEGLGNLLDYVANPTAYMLRKDGRVGNEEEWNEWARSRARWIKQKLSSNLNVDGAK